MKWAPYSRYRECGIDWIGAVPAHWEIGPLKRVIRQIESGTSVNAVDSPATADEIGVLKTSCVYTGRVVDPSENKSVVADERDLVSCPLRSGALIVSRMNTPDLVGAAGLVEAAPANLFLPDRLWQVSFRDVQPSFVHYWTQSASYRVFVRNLCSGTSSSMQNFGQDQFRAIPIAIPPLEEQVAIVDSLGRETAKLDALIAKQERLIELLQEKRQAVISHAVTKGLDPKAPMKHSGVEWLGEIPAHWRAKRLKFISPFITVGIVVNPSIYVADEGLPFIYGGDIAEGRIDAFGARRISDADSRRNQKTRLAAGDLVTVRVGAPGITAVVPKECEGGNCASVMLVRKGSFDSDWLCYAMNSPMVRDQVSVVQYGAAQEQFNISHAINYWVATPPRSEQLEIAAYLGKAVGKLYGLMKLARRSIDLMREHRSALISAAVTGKIDVRKAA